MNNTKISVSKDVLNYKYKGTEYSLKIENGEAKEDGGAVHFLGESISLIPKGE